MYMVQYEVVLSYLDMRAFLLTFKSEFITFGADRDTFLSKSKLKIIFAFQCLMLRQEACDNSPRQTCPV